MTDPLPDDLFAWLLEPVTRTDFFEEIFAREPLLTERGEPDRFRGLVSFEEIDARLRQPGFLQEGGVELGRGEPFGRKPVETPEDAYAGLADGWSLQLTNPHHRFAPDSGLVRVARALEAELGKPPTRGGVFLTPPGVQALARHHDKIDVFTLQISGSKTWELFDRLPMERVAEPSGDEPMTVRRTVRVEQGETFYLPRGIPHRVAADEPDAGEPAPFGGASLSLGFGFLPPTWATVYQVLGRKVTGDPVLAQQMPPRPWDTVEDEEIERHLEHLARLVDELTVKDVRRVLEEARTSRPSPDAEPHLAEVLAREAPGDDDRLVPRSGLAPRVEGSGDRCRLIFAGDRAVEGPQAVRPAFEWVARQEEPFAVREIRGGLTARSRRVLARKLVAEGYLRRAG